jgi:hypothetical protein
MRPQPARRLHAGSCQVHDCTPCQASTGCHAAAARARSRLHVRFCGVAGAEGPPTCADHASAQLGGLSEAGWLLEGPKKHLQPHRFRQVAAHRGQSSSKISSVAPEHDVCQTALCPSIGTCMPYTVFSTPNPRHSPIVLRARATSPGRAAEAPCMAAASVFVWV